MSVFSYIKKQVPIFDEVSRRVSLKLAGSYYKGPCPFHRETDASFTVSPDKQIFYCFGCHAKGDVVSFVAKIENITPIEAVHYLVDAYQLTIPDEIAKQVYSGQARAEDKNMYFNVCKVVAKWAQQQLMLHSHALEYVKSRGISSQSVERFGVGYIPGNQKGLQSLVKECAQQNILVKDLIEAGLFFESRTTIRSPFEDRIIFPITDALGRHCGFGGRIFVPHDERAKYYNSKESEYFVKGSLVFGYALAKKAMQETRAVFLVEGYLDCVMMAQYGYEHTVATLGTACTLEHFQLLSRLVDTVYVVYDGDAAGQKAMLRMAQLCWQVNIDIRVVSLPSKLDPASFLTATHSLDEPIAQAQDIFTFFVTSTAGHFAVKNVAEKLRAIEAIIAIISRIPDMVKQEILLQEAERAVGIPVAALRSRLQGTAVAASPRKMEEQSVTDDGEEMIQEQIIALSINTLLQEEQLVVPAEAYEYFSPENNIFLEKIHVVRSAEYEGNKFEWLLEQCDEKQREWIVHHTMRYGGTVQENEFHALINKVVQQGWKDRVSQIREEIEQATKQGDTEKTQTLLKRFAQLQQYMQQKGLIWQKRQQTM